MRLARHGFGRGLAELVSEVGCPLPLQLQVQELVVGNLQQGEEETPSEPLRHKQSPAFGHKGASIIYLDP